MGSANVLYIHVRIYWMIEKEPSYMFPHDNRVHAYEQDAIVQTVCRIHIALITGTWQE